MIQTLEVQELIMLTALFIRTPNSLACQVERSSRSDPWDRHFWLLANRFRDERLALCHQLHAAYPQQRQAP
jgi:hypothetical protein